MLIKKTRGWEIPESRVTPEAVFLNRREILAASGLGLIAASLPGMARADDDPSAGLYPAKRNDRFVAGRPITPEDINAHYNNFYEYSTDKDLADAAQALKIRPWTIAFEGMVEQPKTVGIDDLLKVMKLEERVYRHRCVEAWSMTVPWTGFPLADLVAYAKPLSGAKYIRMETFMDPDMAPGQNQPFYPWPYVEGLSMAEATNELAFMVTGVYGKPLLKQMGAPIRLHTPWKYGFKSIKSIVKISFVEEQPLNFWQQLQSSEYGFWANVNPEVPHPRWSQATEQVIGTNDRIPTQLFNGYGEFVAGIYKGMEKEPLYM
ncbi:protein-methionine-sulfoxide reductase catalytic subunit MsrP [Kaistia dalseonensis]|uniref:Protein-methionine-sulfoxide reductase catalytic subunit MsrP n=1 Tax=Kaistia dalseonensis TaxID=410840 RepID=A0ABU0HEL9_9HYPH|nr:protein-methionine-sulfoxide reductase catalytic subunit MsrP [Kaistia dalseonensis]MCX5497283.1 protein-methionine-sulfoxide reductase catalytic subunit MsrP [Kaistia dalseonensis]MDQ0439919.1 sulfoxide reductase catalytic subunit YedY [Kaistia dalseonensis]